MDAAEALMVDEGYAAVTVRRVAARAGMKPALVQYYFATMDDLLLATYRRAAQRSIDRQQAALASDRPLEALWQLTSDAGHAALAVEFMALANHRKAIRAEIAAFSERARAIQADIVATVLGHTAIDQTAFPPPGVALLLTGAARALVMEAGLGIDAGHEDARLIVERWLATIAPAI